MARVESCSRSPSPLPGALGFDDVLPGHAGRRKLQPEAWHQNAASCRTFSWRGASTAADRKAAESRACAEQLQRATRGLAEAVGDDCEIETNPDEEWAAEFNVLRPNQGATPRGTVTHDATKVTTAPVGLGSLELPNQLIHEPFVPTVGIVPGSAWRNMALGRDFTQEPELLEDSSGAITMDEHSGIMVLGDSTCSTDASAGGCAPLATGGDGDQPQEARAAAAATSPDPDASKVCVPDGEAAGTQPAAEGAAVDDPGAPPKPRRPRPTAKPPPPPPPKRGGVSGYGGAQAEEGLPPWRGPRPPEGWKAQRVVNWRPIRQPGRWKGSVWQQVYANMEECNFDMLEGSELNEAFLRRLEGAEPAASSRQPVPARRVLPPAVAFTADLRHAQLTRCGFGEAAQLRWAVGDGPHAGIGLAAAGSRLPTLPEEALEALLGLLKAADGYEEQLNEAASQGVEECDELNRLGDAGSSGKQARLAPAEALLCQLLSKVASLAVLQHRVEDALFLARFAAQTATLEQQLHLGIGVVDAVVKSTTLPTLLGGVLLLGNYVNASSRGLGEAVGVTLDSLAKLAHTKCLTQQQQQDAAGDSAGAVNSSGTAHLPNALALLMQQLQDKQGGPFWDNVIADLEGCKAARDLEPAALLKELQQLKCGIDRIAARQDAKAYDTIALTSRRLSSFLEEAVPRTGALSALLQDLGEATGKLRKHFAEPSGSSFVDMIGSLALLLEALHAARAACQLAAVEKTTASASTAHVGSPPRARSRAPSRGAAKRRPSRKPTSTRRRRRALSLPPPGAGGAAATEAGARGGPAQAGMQRSRSAPGRLDEHKETPSRPSTADAAPRQEARRGPPPPRPSTAEPARRRSRAARRQQPSLAPAAATSMQAGPAAASCGAKPLAARVALPPSADATNVA